MSKIAVYGYYGHKNAGDEAFRLVFDEMLRGHVVQYFSPSTIEEYGGDFDVLVLGGGNVMGSYFLKPLIEKGWKVCPKKLAIGVGLSDDQGLVLAKALEFDKILMRNQSEVSKACDLKSVAFVPDLVLSLEPRGDVELPAAFSAIAPSCQRKKSVAFVVSMEYFPEMARSDRQEAYLEFDRSIAALSAVIETLIPDCNIALFAISSDPYHYDEVAARLLFRACPSAWKSVVVINTQGDAGATLDALRGYDCVFSMKYHGLIFALLNGVPVINISRNIKNMDLMQLLDTPELTMSLMDGEVPKERLDDLMVKAEGLRSQMKTKVSGFRTQINELLHRELGMIEQ